MYGMARVIDFRENDGEIVAGRDVADGGGGGMGRKKEEDENKYLNTPSGASMRRLDFHD
jgi:hypothetical protein